MNNSTNIQSFLRNIMEHSQSNVTNNESNMMYISETNSVSQATSSQSNMTNALQSNTLADRSKMNVVNYASPSNVISAYQPNISNPSDGILRTTSQYNGQNTMVNDFEANQMTTSFQSNTINPATLSNFSTLRRADNPFEVVIQQNPILNLLLQAYQLSMPGNCVDDINAKNKIETNRADSVHVNNAENTATFRQQLSENFPNATATSESEDVQNTVDISDSTNSLGKQNIPSSIHPTGSSINPKKSSIPKKPSIKINENWIRMNEFSLDVEMYNKIYKNGRIQHYIFASYLNKTYEEVTCVLRSIGTYKRVNDLLTLRYQCSHSSDYGQCLRQYKVFQILGNKFSLFRNNKDVTHDPEKKITRHVRGEQRNEVKAKLKSMAPEQYLNECERAADQKLLVNGNIQDCVSYSTVAKIRSEMLQEDDFDKDDIIDLLMMKILQGSTNNLAPEERIHNYIRRIGLDPFLITLFSEEQFKCLKLMKQKSPNIPIEVHIDATGGVGKHGAKKIFYYAGVVPDTSLLSQLKPNEHRKVLQLFEEISGAHDTFNISLVLMEYKYEFHKKFPTMEWPIEHAVTDFSYAILNAICLSWNTMKLIDYINCLYNALISNTPWSKCDVATFIHICCCHMPKNYAKDVKEFFPNMGNENQNILKEIFAGMFSIKDIEILQTIWKNFSTTLMSKYVDNNVTAALEELSKIMTTEEQLKEKNCQHEHEDEEDELIEEHFPLSDETKVPTTDDHQAIYKSSRFYQHFKTIMFSESFATREAPLNVFYSPQFANMFLQKYITILPLWTCFERRSNAYSEGHFKDSKKRIIRDRDIFGKPPLKCGRLVKLLRNRVEEVTNSILQAIPKYRCTAQKRKSADNPPRKIQKKNLQDDVIPTYSTVETISIENNLQANIEPTISHWIVRV